MVVSDKKKQNFMVLTWLILYNIAMTAGWAIIGIGIVNHFIKNQSYRALYSQVEKQLLFFQTCAVLEIIHAMLGMVKSNVTLTFLQVFSRVGIVWGVIQPIPEVHDQVGFTMLLVAWTITEIIRYLFYTFMLMGITPIVLQWLRYTLFIILYPLGVTGELLSIYYSLVPIRNSGLYSFSLPNIFNFSIDYYLVLMGTIPLYVIFFPQLYFHMFSQRKKVLRSVSRSPSAKKVN